MATKTKPASKTSPKLDQMPATPEKSAEKRALDEKAHAKAVISPSLASTFTRQQFADPSLSGLGQLNWVPHWQAITEACEKVNGGDMARPEGMLMSQAMTLDAIFNRCAALAGHNLAERMGAADTLLRMALKAQGQCAQTLRVLGELKHPRAPATFVKQQNNATTQQVNNAPVTQGAAAHAHGEKETANTTNELLEHQHGERLDTGAARQAGRVNQAVATVDESDRSEDRRG